MKSMCLRVSFKSLVWKVGIFQNNCQVREKQFLLIKSYMGFIGDLALGVSSYLSINDCFFISWMLQHWVASQEGFSIKWKNINININI
jgi:hypothetical protein